MIRAVTSRTNVGTLAGTGGRTSNVDVTVSGTFTSDRCASAASTAAKFFRTTASPRRPYVFSIACLMAATASAAGSTPLMAKKQVCMMVFTRPAMPASRATREPSMTKKCRRFAMSCSCTERGR